jgi:peptide-methionine (S)-S-oxide reductase
MRLLLMKMNKTLLFLLISVGLTTSCESQKTADKNQVSKTPDQMIPSDMKTETATFGAGCFWCVEAVFQELKGVLKVESGFMGGTLPNPTYRDVCTGTTGHAEVARITFDPAAISYDELLEVLWTTHDPTTMNRQGADAGTQYRSAIFYYSDEQKQAAEKSKAEVAPTIWDQTIVTQIVPATTFYPAEDYHQNYYANNQNEGYCRIVINPKIQKVRTKFKDKLKVQN